MLVDIHVEDDTGTTTMHLQLSSRQATRTCRVALELFVGEQEVEGWVGVCQDVEERLIRVCLLLLQFVQHADRPEATKACPRPKRNSFHPPWCSVYCTLVIWQMNIIRQS